MTKSLDPKEEKPLLGNKVWFAAAEKGKHETNHAFWLNEVTGMPF